MVNFTLIDTRSRKIALITASARKCRKLFRKGLKIEIWSNDSLIETIYNKNIADLSKYITQEKEYISNKQKRATERNRFRKTGGAIWPRTSLQS